MHIDGWRAAALLALLGAGLLLSGCFFLGDEDDDWGDDRDDDRASYASPAPTYRGAARRAGGGQGTHATGTRRRR